ncbi:alpha/beta fold hydrolase [Diaminobutyricimonas sp. LJ205]|uniref:alpha/beta fold hydrolase n=1 Tax=Diaminobutyricimonas sp. LJ205 TaxID=2683590 RepID=UPI001E4A1C46|nr:alpha/beta fold hydrolase [Diaminobutyricimonas sp. LJ205]
MTARDDEQAGTPVDDVVRRDALLPDLDWSALPDGVDRVSIPAPSGSLAALQAGAPGAPPVVLVPGVTGSKEDFVLMLPLLSAGGVRVTAYDMAGQYESAAAGPAAGRTWDYDLFVDDLIAVLEAVGAPAHVLGYSFAGTITQLALARRPDLFASLTLLTCPPDPGRVLRRVRWIGRLSTLATDALIARLMVWGLRSNVLRAPAGRLRLVTHRFEFTRPDSIAAVMGLMQRTPDVEATVAASAIPKLVAVGKLDLWPLRRHAAFASRIGARLAVYRTGHSPCETAPHQLCRDLLELYAEV